MASMNAWRLPSTASSTVLISLIAVAPPLVVCEFSQSGHCVAECAEFCKSDGLILSDRCEHHWCLEVIFDLAEILLLLGPPVGEEGVVAVLLRQEVVCDDECGLDADLVLQIFGRAVSLHQWLGVSPTARETNESSAGLLPASLSVGYKGGDEGKTYGGFLRAHNDTRWMPQGLSPKQFKNRSV